MQRTGDVIVTSYWTGHEWAEAARATVGFDAARIGLYALAAGSAPSHEATFDYFALVAPEGADIVPEGTFTFEGSGDTRYLTAGADGALRLDGTRPLEQLALTATEVDGDAGGEASAVRPVVIRDSASDRPLVVDGDRLTLGADGAEATVLRLTDVGGGRAALHTVDGRFIVLGDGGALVVGDEADAARLTVVPVEVTEHTIEIDTDAPRTDMSDDLYGIFYEDINYAADGGIYAELVRNRSFEFNSSDNRAFTGLTAWEKVERGATGSIAVGSDRARWLNDSNRVSLTIQANGAGVGVRNIGFNRGFALEEGESYDFSVWARSATAQQLTVAVENAAGTEQFALGTVDVAGDDTWRKVEVRLTSNATTDAGRLVLLGGAAGSLQLDMVSLFPVDTWVGPVNGPSVLRKDLAEKVAELEPSFLRFPGGCVTNVGTFNTYLESDGQDRRRTYQWKETIGPVEERPTNWNFWGYNQSYGLGYLEYLKWAEDLGATPLPVVSVGANGCGSTIPEMTDQARIDRWVQDTVDLIEFAKGDVTTEWGAKRAELGHPEPFDLRYIGLGNEENTDTFQANFPKFRDAVEAAWPEVTIISNSGPDDTGARFDELWQFNREQGVDMVDEHYYNDPSWFLQNSERYDAYDREGPHVFLGEYASRGNTFANALSEAAYMTGLERNSDVVELASYAPMFANEDHVQWAPDMMWFDNDESWGSVNYYTQQMFMTNVGDEVVPSTHTEADRASDLDGGAFLSTWRTSAAYDDVRVTDNATGDELYAESFDGTDDPWSPVAGSWAVTGGEYVQSSTTTTDARSLIPDAYATGLVELHARARRTQGVGRGGLPHRLRRGRSERLLLVEPRRMEQHPLGVAARRRRVGRRGRGTRGQRRRDRTRLPREDRGRRLDDRALPRRGAAAQLHRACGARPLPGGHARCRDRRAPAQGREPDRFDGAHPGVRHGRPGDRRRGGRDRDGRGARRHEHEGRSREPRSRGSRVVGRRERVQLRLPGVLDHVPLAQREAASELRGELHTGRGLEEGVLGRPHDHEHR